jgi:hypothetical protein
MEAGGLVQHLRFHEKPLCVCNGNEGFPLETEMETKDRKWKRTGNEVCFLETDWKRGIALLGNEVPTFWTSAFQAKTGQPSPVENPRTVTSVPNFGSRDAPQRTVR